MSTSEPRPVIGVTGQHKDIQTVPGTDRAVAVATTYTEMVWEAGGLPVVLVPGDLATIPMLLDRLDGLVFTGGPDVDPRLYDGDTDTFYFRWRVAQIANTYATGPKPGSYSDSDPWN